MSSLAQLYCCNTRDYNPHLSSKDVLAVRKPVPNIIILAGRIMQNVVGVIHFISSSSFELVDYLW